MKNIKLFEEFLLEFKSVGNLYHFTTLKGLSAILSTDKMISMQYDHISFTRNPALKFYDRNIRIVFDGDEMSNRIHIEPYMYDEDKDPLFKSEFDDATEPRMSDADRRKVYGDEREERASSPINGVRKYITRVDVKIRRLRNGEVDEDFMKKVNVLAAKYPGIEFDISDKFHLPVERKLQAA